MSKLKNEADIQEIQQLTVVVEEETNKLLAETAAFEVQAVKLIEANSMKALSTIHAGEIAIEERKKAEAYKERAYHPSDCDQRSRR